MGLRFGLPQDYLTINAPGVGPQSVPAGRATELKIGEGVLNVRVTVDDNRVTASTSVAQPMSLVRINSGNTNPAGYQAGGNR